MIAVHSTYGDNHFMMDVSHIIRFYTFNMYSAVCQLYINKAERKKKRDHTTYTSFHSKGDMDFSHTDQVHL